jgi:hypothetical protein
VPLAGSVDLPDDGRRQKKIGNQPPSSSNYPKIWIHGGLGLLAGREHCLSRGSNQKLKEVEDVTKLY